MSRDCSVCSHPDAAEINARLVGIGGKRSNRTIAKQYALHHSSVQRHRDHIPDMLTKAREADQTAQADELLAQVKALQAKTVNMLLTAERIGDLRTGLAAIAQARQNVELLAKLAGRLSEAPVIELHLHPEWIQLRATIVETLGAHPAARADVIAAIAAVSNGTS